MSGKEPRAGTAFNIMEIIMTHCHPLLIASQNWTFALRTAAGYPTFTPAFHTVTWCSSGRNDVFQAQQLAELVADLGADLVHVTMNEAMTEPAGVSIVVREGRGVRLLPVVQLYCASETSRIELLTRDRRWLIGPRHILTSAKLPPKARWSRGKEIAWRRWRQALAAQGELDLKGNLWVPAGGSYADAVRHENFDLAA